MGLEMSLQWGSEILWAEVGPEFSALEFILGGARDACLSILSLLLARVSSGHWPVVLLQAPSWETG